MTICLEEVPGVYNEEQVTRCDFCCVPALLFDDRRFWRLSPGGDVACDECLPVVLAEPA